MRVDAPLVSRLHAIVEATPSSWRVRDLDSTNGTFVNRRQVDVHDLQNGDIIEVGPARFRFGGSGSLGVDARPPRLRSSQPSRHSASARSAAGSQPARVQGSEAGDVTIIPGYALGQTWEGGHATVYHARRISDKRECAIKILKVEDSYLREKFDQESRVLLGFRHPNVVQAFDCGVVNGRRYIAMEWCGGGNLRRLLMERGRPPASDIISILGQACEGLQYAHREGVIHRDLKPEHLMFDARGSVKVVDFGVAKSQMSLTQTAYGNVVGTPAYLSPEQARGDRVDTRTDIYAMGVILYELLTGAPPFTGSYTDILDHHLRSVPRAPQSIVPDCDPRLAQVAMRALSKDPRQRFASALDMANAMGYRSSGSSGSRPVS